MLCNRAECTKAGRWTSELGNSVDRSSRLWDQANTLRIATLTAAHLQPLLLLLAYPQGDISFVATLTE
jgi:hypothetical protein